MQQDSSPVLYILATPLGNLEDITLRALKILKSVDVVLCEDTRRARKLFSHYEIPTPRLISYYDHVERKKADIITAKIFAEKLSCALISDAGTPLIADPGYRLVCSARKLQIPVVPVPGPSALTAIASVSGLSVHRILFIGFLPTKKSKRSQEVASWQNLNGSVICYENIRRLPKTLALIFEHHPEALVVVGRELTKKYEEIKEINKAIFATLAAKDFIEKGECTLMIETNPKTPKKENKTTETYPGM